MKIAQSEEQICNDLQTGTKVLFFTADWCGDCNFIKPVMPEIEADFPAFEFIQVDRDQFIDLCIEMGIMGIPSFVVYRDGQEIGRFVNKNCKTKEEIETFLGQF